MLKLGSWTFCGALALMMPASRKGWPSAIQTRVGMGPSTTGFMEYMCQPSWIRPTSFMLKRAPGLSAVTGVSCAFQATGSGPAAASTRVMRAVVRSRFMSVNTHAVRRGDHALAGRGAQIHEGRLQHVLRLGVLHEDHHAQIGVLDLVFFLGELEGFAAMAL